MPSIISKIRILIPDIGDRPRERKKGGSVKTQGIEYLNYSEEVSGL